LHLRESAAARDPSEDAKAAKVLSLLAGASLKEVQKQLATERLKREACTEWTRTAHISIQWSRNATEIKGVLFRDAPRLLASRLNLSIEQELEAENVMDELLARIASLHSEDGLMEDERNVAA
jgi:hypothetical protein